MVRAAGVLETGPQAVSVWVELPKLPEFPLRHGQTARVTLVTADGASTLSLPRTAVVHEGTQSFVFVELQDGTFERRTVTTGREDDRRVEVAHGLNPGERVVVRGAPELQTAYASVR